MSSNLSSYWKFSSKIESESSPATILNVVLGYGSGLFSLSLYSFLLSSSSFFPFISAKVSSLSLTGWSLPVREDICGSGSDANFAVASFSAS